jgi:hypothetical protein
MATNYDQPDTVRKRVRFFDGQYLQDQDFVDEQKFHIDRQRRHHRTLHVAGIADGLTVSKSADGAARVTVTPGTAIDSDGRQLVLAEAVTTELAGAQLANKTLNLYLIYREQPADLQTQAGSRDHSRWLENPEIKAVVKGEAPGGDYPPVLLAELTLDASGNITAVSDNVRQYSGLRLPGPGAAASTLRADAAGLVRLQGALSVSGNVGIGTTTPKAFQVTLPESSKGGNMPGAGVTIAGGDSASIELRGTGTPYIDFAKDAATTDFHARIRLTATDKLAIEGANVGIGTTDPGSNKLKVAGNTYLDGTLTATGNTSIGASASLSFGSQVRQMINLWDTRYGIGVQNSTQYFRTAKNFAWYKDGVHNDAELSAGTGGSAQMVIKDGNVGIGTDTAAQKLIVVGQNNAGKDADSGMSSGGQLAIKGNAPQLDFIDTDSNDWSIHVNSNKMYFVRQPWNYTDLVLDGSGNVGIGTDGPVNKLTVSSSGTHLQLRREATETTGGKSVFLELYQDDTVPTAKVPEVYPSIRFSHNNRYWHRIEGRSDGLHFKDGNLASDSYTPIRTGAITATGNVAVSGSLSVASGQSVAGIPIIDFQHGQQRFTGNRGAAKKVTYTFSFSRPVLSAQPMLVSWFLRYENREYVKEAGVGCYDTRISGNRVEVDVSFYFKDASGTYDDPYEGEAIVAVIAKLAQTL